MEDLEEHDEVPFGIERCAEIGAHVAHFRRAPRAELFDRLAVEAEDYDRSRRHWMRAVAEELACDGDVLANRFGTAFGRTKETLDVERPALDSLGPRRLAAGAGAPSASSATVERMIAAPPSSSRAGAATATALRLSASSGAEPADTRPMPPPAQAGVQLASFQVLERRPPTLPHSGPSAGTPALAPAVPHSSTAGLATRAATAPAVGAVTEWLPSSVALEAATPFSELDPGAKGVSLSRYVEIVAALQEANTDTGQLLADRGLTNQQWEEINAHYEQKFRREARWSMEFGRLLAAAQKALRDRREDAQRPVPRTTRHVSQGEARPTQALEITPALPELTLDQYAWIVASIRASAASDLPALLTRFRLTPESHRALEARWRERMASDPVLAESFATRLRAVNPPTPAAAGVPGGALIAEKHTSFISERSSLEAPSGAALPFAPGDARVRPAFTPSKTPEVSRDGFTELPRSSAGRGSPLPFAKSPPSGRLPLDRYAEISAELERDGDPTATFKRLAIDPATFVSTVHSYSARFAEDRSLEQEYKRLLALATKRLRQAPR